MVRSVQVKRLANEIYKTLLSGVEKGIEQSNIPIKMRLSLEENTFIFSGFKALNQMREASSLLLNEKGKIKPFDTFKRDILKINEAYNERYLRSEYDFAVASSQSAAKWAELTEEENENYVLQYRTAGDERVRINHQGLHNTTLNANDPFWDSYYPPNGWGCRCNVVRVINGKYPLSNSKEAIKQGDIATTQITKKGENKAAIFRFNPGKTGKVFPPTHPYFKADKQAQELIKSMHGKWEKIETKSGELWLNSLQTPQEKDENVRIGKFLAEKHNHKIMLVAPANLDKVKSADAFNVTLNRKEEYKAPNGSENSIRTAIKKGCLQANNLVLEIPDKAEITIERCIQVVKGQLMQSDPEKKVQTIQFIKEEELYSITRKQIDSI